MVDQYIQDNSLSTISDEKFKITIEYLIEKYRNDTHIELISFLLYELYGVKERLGEYSENEKKEIFKITYGTKEYWIYKLKFIKRAITK